MPGNWHVRFGGGPYGKGPATCGHLAVRPTQPSAERRVCPNRAQITQVGAALDGRHAKGCLPIKVVPVHVMEGDFAVERGRLSR